MATTSFPAVGTGGLTDVQWGVMYGAKDGIIEDYTGTSCSLSRLNASNIARVSTGKVSVNGYVLDITSDEDLYCAPVVVPNPPVTYHIAAMYDPALNVADGDLSRSDAGPCRLIISTGALDMSGGKAYTILYSLTRTSSQVLSDSEKVDRRRWTGPVVEFDVYQSVVSGTTAYPRGTVRYEQSTSSTSIRTLNDAGTALEWRSLSGGPDIPFPAPGALVAYSAPATYYKANGRVYLTGTLKRSSGSNLSTGADVLLGTLPVGARPADSNRFLCHANAGRAVGVRVFSDGTVVMSDPDEANSFIDLSSISFRVA